MRYPLRLQMNRLWKNFKRRLLEFHIIMEIKKLRIMIWMVYEPIYGDSIAKNYLQILMNTMIRLIPPVLFLKVPIVSALVKERIQAMKLSIIYCKK